MMTGFELGLSWQKALKDELQKPYLQELEAFVERERFQGFNVFPPRELVFNAFRMTPYESVRVVIMGQDPYHGPRQAHGLSFSVPEGVRPPPSLQNIIKELNADVQIPIPKHGCLIHWAEQGVLLLNATLTVRQGEPLSHHGKGWERFTDAVIEHLVNGKENLIFILWGKSAQEKCRHIIASHEEKKHHILMAAHPSPYAAQQGFFGCRHFSKVNDILRTKKQEPIDWAIP
ncbi:Uracil-DNA glycosylase [Neochlamydia sp. EPS4]|nr:Uracil-DNA glycosylase [Neochlamydia sp. EPS4]